MMCIEWWTFEICQFLSGQFGTTVRRTTRNHVYFSASTRFLLVFLPFFLPTATSRTDCRYASVLLRIHDTAGHEVCDCVETCAPLFHSPIFYFRSIHSTAVSIRVGNLLGSGQPAMARTAAIVAYLTQWSLCMENACIFPLCTESFTLVLSAQVLLFGRLCSIWGSCFPRFTHQTLKSSRCHPHCCSSSRSHTYVDVLSVQDFAQFFTRVFFLTSFQTALLQSGLQSCKAQGDKLYDFWLNSVTPISSSNMTFIHE